MNRTFIRPNIRKFSTEVQHQNTTWTEIFKLIGSGAGITAGFSTFFGAIYVYIDSVRKELKDDMKDMERNILNKIESKRWWW